MGAGNPFGNRAGSGCGFPGRKENWGLGEPLPGLEGADGIDLGHVDDGAHGLEGSTAALPHLQRGKVQQETGAGLGRLPRDAQLREPPPAPSEPSGGGLDSSSGHGIPGFGAI